MKAPYILSAAALAASLVALPPATTAAETTVGQKIDNAASATATGVKKAAKATKKAVGTAASAVAEGAGTAASAVRRTGKKVAKKLGPAPSSPNAGAPRGELEGKTK